MPLMPKRVRPALGHRNLAVRQAGDKRIEIVEREHLATRFLGKALKERQIYRQVAKLLRLRLDRPAGLALADRAAIGRVHIDTRAVRPRGARRKRRLIE